MIAIINGYGVPKNILTDTNYNSYLGQVFNYLWTRYKNKRLTVILCGGAGDMIAPYKRTEAGEMARWFTPRIKQLKLEKYWQLQKKDQGLSVLENMLACKKSLVNQQALFFCEATREKKVKILAEKILGSKVKVIPIEFDLSPARYDLAVRIKLEQEDLVYSLRALKDPIWRKKLALVNKEKIRLLRKLSPRQRVQMIDKLARKLRQELIR